MGDCGVQVCPHLGQNLQQSLFSLQERLSSEATPESVRKTGQCVEVELEQWSGRAAAYFKEKANEVKEIMMAVARTAEAVGERDLRYTRQFNDFTGRLRSIANLEDITQMRHSLVESATELKTCVDRMAQDGEASAAQLRAELSAYQTRLEEAERLASIDSLTGLANRRRVEQQLELRVAQGRKFCVLIFDLNGFKQINDEHGHLAGDDLLRQFGLELRAAFRATDVVGRWGGDEFIVVLGCGLDEAQVHIGRVKEWAFGEYTVKIGAGPRKVSVNAAIGIAEWKAKETVAQMLARADRDMYQQKNRAAARRPA
jgi:diguanylate cyclase (GGDEF)-like protein